MLAVSACLYLWNLVLCLQVPKISSHELIRFSGSSLDLFSIARRSWSHNVQCGEQNILAVLMDLPCHNTLLDMEFLWIVVNLIGPGFAGYQLWLFLL